ncbi:hypothetical protein [Halalkalibacter okhensis]|uniref:Uncharacterized protein n=1 Tax=Halalkalibacter okhensis TaxID=333138 RepID=A0A0B0IL91_9BACI|nr:hypothetical protein [Halalkalibacter okhensis]KHF40406.1 hypothetical protein LQ50_09020 [Halalkalibacter okhensis]
MLNRTYDIKNGELKQAIEKSGLELREFATMSLEKMNVKSKKKRIRQKALKRAFTHKEVAKEILLMVQGDNKASKQEDQKVVQAVEGNDSAASVRGLPVTFLLKLGKKYLKDEEVVRFYYNADKEEFYKNKNLLEQVIETNSKNLDSTQLAQFQNDVMEELEKRAKK